MQKDKNWVNFRVCCHFLLHVPHHVFFQTELSYPVEPSIFLSCTLYHELFQFFANHVSKLLRDWNTSSNLCRRCQIQPFFQKKSFVVIVHLQANENYFRIQIHNFIKFFFHLNRMKTRTFSRRWLRHCQFFSKWSNYFTLELSPFWKIYDNLLTILGDCFKFENLDCIGTNFKLDAVTRPFFYDWFQSLR